MIQPSDDNASTDTIVIVDDDDAVRDSMTALLEINGRNVLSYASAHEFLTNFNGPAYCLVLDVEMPGMSGPELVRYLSERAKLPPTVMLTAHAEERMTQATLSYGVHAILPKPTSETVLLAMIDQAANA